MPEQEKKETEEERRQRKLAEARKNLEKTRAQHQIWVDSGRKYQIYDAYEQFHTQLDEEEQETFDDLMKLEEDMRKNPPRPEELWEKGFIDGDGRLALSPARQAHMKIALDRASAQLNKFPYPEEPGLTEKYPGVDPYGMHTEAEMAFNERLAKVKAALELRPPEVQAYVRGVLEDMSKLSTPIGKQVSAAAERYFEFRQLNRAAKVALDRSTSEHLEEEAYIKEVSSLYPQWEDRTIQTLESLAGLNDKPITDLQRQEMSRFKCDIPPAVEALRNAPNIQPAGLKVEFPSFDHVMEYQFLTNPRNWNKTLKDMPRDIAPDKVEVVSEAISRFASATASRTLDGCFHQIESLTQRRADPQGGSMINRCDLVTVDGLTIREHMQKEYLDAHKSLQGFPNYFQKNSQRMSGEIVSAALMSGKRVEAFIPDKMGRVPKEPVQITKSGYEPSPLKKVTLNAWERHFAKHGFFKKKLARAEEYRRVMEARERVQTINAYQSASLRDAGNDFMKNQIFGGEDVLNEAMKDHHTQYIWSRGFPVSLAVSSLVAQGHSFDDIIDPDKLQEEKLAAGREVIERTRNDDHDWIGRTFHDGYMALAKDVDQKFSKFNVADPRQMQEHMSDVRGPCGILFDIYQEAGRPGTLEGFLAGAEERSPGNATQAEFEMEERARTLGTLALGMDHILEGKICYSNPNLIQQAELKELTMATGKMTNYASGLIVCERFAQVMQGGVPASRAMASGEAISLSAGAACLSGITTPLVRIADKEYRGKYFGAVQYLMAHDKLKQALPITVERQAKEFTTDSYALGADGKAVRIPRKIEAGQYSKQVDMAEFVKTLKEGVKKLESARKLEQAQQKNEAEAEAKQEKEAAKAEAKPAKEAAKAKPAPKAKSAGRTI